MGIEPPKPPPMQTVRRGLIDPQALWVLVPLAAVTAALWLYAITVALIR
ncbi:hypothetical protein KIKIMORA_02490 [Brevundimonas phage vB_BpoS-Kikimora]|uniref:Uncharacterized protein n=1 Tax=Brevundimonas phage vB_BpoS-Kikimora TaxID=2948601 RepID=A0A9E7MSR2_9CAUD|nr:hypothetical protein KIKIMORA_02490 [Brevundimonas phage vB_BpoS-Kikimora]